MVEVRRFVVMACLVVLGGVALHRVLGTKAAPITILALVSLANASWRAWRDRLGEIRRSVVALRPYEAEARWQAMRSLESDELRTAVAQELTREGSESRQGMSEIFPFPAVFRRRATVRYWRAWALSAAALLVAAFLPELAAPWRLVWLVLGIGLGVRARRTTYLYQVAASVVEINPYRISHVWPDGARQTVSFADGARCEDMPDDGMFVVRSGQTAIPVSYQLLGFNRLAQLVEQYGAEIPTSGPPAS